MKRFGRVLVALLMLTSFTPTMVFGSVGDVIAVSKGMRYSISHPDATAKLKSDLKSGVVTESDMVVELEDGKYVYYNEKKNAERTALKEFLLEKNVDLTSSSEIANAVINNAEELELRQQESVDALENIKLPSKITDATDDTTNLGDADFGYNYKDGVCNFKVISLKTMADDNYDGEFHVRFKDLTGNLVDTQVGVFGEYLTVVTSTEVYVEISKDDTFTNSLRIKLPMEEDWSDWKLDKTNSTAIVGVSGSTEEGFTVAYSLNLIEKKGEETRTYEGNPTLVLCDYYNNDNTILNVPLTDGLVGETKFTNINYPVVSYLVKDGDTILLKGKLTVSDYSVSGLVDINVDTTQPTDRRRLEITPTKLNENYVDNTVFVEIRQGDSIVEEKQIEFDVTYLATLTEGEYTVNVYPTEDKSALLFTDTFDFKHALPDSLCIVAMPDGVNSNMVPWDYDSRDLELILRPQYKGYDQLEENFLYRITDTTTSSETIISCQSTDKIAIGVQPGSEYKIELLNNSYETLTTFYYTPPHYTQIEQGVFLRYNSKRFSIVLSKCNDISIKNVLSKYESMILNVTYTDKTTHTVTVESEEYQSMLETIDADYDTIRLFIPLKGTVISTLGNLTVSFKDYHGNISEYGGVLALDGELVDYGPVTSAYMASGTFLETQTLATFDQNNSTTNTVTEDTTTEESSKELDFVEENLYIKRDEDETIASFSIDNEIDDWDIALPELN